MGALSSGRVDSTQDSRAETRQAFRFQWHWSNIWENCTEIMNFIILSRIMSVYQTFHSSQQSFTHKENQKWIESKMKRTPNSLLSVCYRFFIVSALCSLQRKSLMNEVIKFGLSIEVKISLICVLLVATRKQSINIDSITSIVSHLLLEPRTQRALHYGYYDRSVLSSHRWLINGVSHRRFIWLNLRRHWYSLSWRRLNRVNWFQFQSEWVRLVSEWALSEHWVSGWLVIDYTCNDKPESTTICQINETSDKSAKPGSESSDDDRCQRLAALGHN